MIKFYTVLRVLSCTLFFFIAQSTFSQVEVVNYNFIGGQGWFNGNNNFRGDWVLNSGGNSYLRPNRTFDYRSRVDIEVFSPLIDLSGYTNLTLDLDYFFDTEAGDDGMRIEYSINGGAYQVLGDTASGYYNSTVSALGGDGWSGENIPGTTQFSAAPQLNLSAFDPALDGASNVRFKVVFKADDGIQFDGVAIDNFIIRANVNSSPEIEVLGNGLTINSGDTTPDFADFTNFGSIEENIDTQSYTFTILNSGSLDLNLIGTPLVDIINDTGEFTVTVIPSLTTLGPNGTTTFEITYTPTTQGIHTATVSIANNDSNENPYTFDIVGEGIGDQPEIRVEGNSNNISDGSITSSNTNATYYGFITQGISVTKTYYIYNDGTLVLDLTGIAITGTNDDQFSFTPIQDSALEPGQSTFFNVTYTPTSAGSHTAIVSIVNNDADENPFDFVIGGDSLGQQPEITVDGANVIIENNDTSPNSFDGTDYGNTVVGIPETRQFRITNTGLADLLLTSPPPNYIQISGPGAAAYSVSLQPSTSTISASGGFVVFEITYNPATPGTFEAQVYFENNDDDESFYVFDIIGNSVSTPEPEIEVSGNVGVPLFDGDTSPSLLDNTDFGTVYYGQSKNFTHGIRNLGTANLVLQNPPGFPAGVYVEVFNNNSPVTTPMYDPYGSGPFSLVSPPPLPTGTIPPSDIYAPYTILYEPTTPGPHTATVRIRSNDTDEAIFTYTIGGVSGENPNSTYTIEYENFNASNGGWSATNTSGTGWTYGDNPNEVASDGNSWYVMTAAGQYVNNSEAILTSPVMDFTGFKTLELWVDIRIATETFYDGMSVEYSDDAGSTWSLLGTDTTTGSRNWYNTETVVALGTSGWSGYTSAGPGASASDSSFERAFIKLPNSLENSDNIRFRFKFESDNMQSAKGVNIDNFFIKGNPITPYAAPAIAPGGEGRGITLWLKADDASSPFVDGEKVTTWSDQAIDNDAVALAATAPTFYDNPTENINFNPVVDFTRADKTRLVGKGGLNSKDYWVVVKTDGSINDSSDPEYAISGRKNFDQFSQDSSGLVFGQFSQRFTDTNELVSHIVGSVPQSLGSVVSESYGRAITTDVTPSYTNDEVFMFFIRTNEANQITEIFKNGRRMDNYTGLTTATKEVLPLVEALNSQYNLGISTVELNGSSAETAFNGKIAEVISYTSASALVARIKIQTYLGIKYGITITPSAAPTYNSRYGNQYLIDTTTRILWNPTSPADVVNSFDVTGIGRDDASGLDQRQSKNSNDASVLTIGLTDIYETNNINKSDNSVSFDDLDFLIWGNNGAPLDAGTPIFVDLSSGLTDPSSPTTLVSFLSIQRSWRVKEFGSVGTVKISLPETTLSATITPPGDFLMFISDSQSFSPTSEYKILKRNGANLETTYDFDGEKYITFGYAPDYIYERSVDFDGAVDYMDAGNNIDLASSFTASAWIKRGPNSANTDIFSKRNTAPYTDGYVFGIDGAGNLKMSWRTGGGTENIMLSSVAIPLNEWHHVAVSYNGSEASMFIDGVQDGPSVALPAPSNSTEHFLVGASNYTTPSNFFDGTIDEVQVWNTALTVDQLRYIMNQEIESVTGNASGKILPQSISKNEVAAIPWNDLETYFQMNKYTYTNIKDDSNNGHIAAIKNLDTVDEQTAPLPYQSENDGAFDIASTWSNGSLMQKPNGNSIVDGSAIDWNIVKIANDVTYNDNATVLGLIIDSNELTIKDDKMLKVTHYLKLDGSINLEGESQLVQTANSDLDVTSDGFIEKDQAGTAGEFAYNVWAAPVGNINTSENNQEASIATFLRDGTDANAPANISFSSSPFGASASPFTLSDYWMYTYINAPDNSGQFVRVGSTTPIAPGYAYTMKGPGSGGVSDLQNYTFIGKPNNSTDAITIEHPIDANNISMVGNPFPSALDAYDFIDDNPHLKGELYFWEHWGGGSHYTQEYRAGYATLSKGGAVPAPNHPNVSQTPRTTTDANIPKRYIAPGQGFFVQANTAGNIVFSNSQRDFELLGANSEFMFQENDRDDNIATRNTQNIIENINPASASLHDGEDMRSKIRIGFDSPELLHRQLLLTEDVSTTFDLDRGYDAVQFHNQPEDMMWQTANDEFLTIQAVPNVIDYSFPLRVITRTDGEMKIGIDAVENFNLSNNIVYVYDSRLDTYTDIRNEPYIVSVIADDYSDRFSIVFRAEQEEEVEEEVVVIEDESSPEVEEILSTSVDYNIDSEMITILKKSDTVINSVDLYSILGQLTQQWTPDNFTSEVRLPLANNLATGVYIVQVHTEFRTITKKIIVK